MFGTFQPEEEQADYGITKPVGSYNPITLVFHEWRDIAKDLVTAKSFSQGWKLVFGRPSEIEKEKKLVDY